MIVVHCFSQASDVAATGVLNELCLRPNDCLECVCN